MAYVPLMREQVREVVIGGRTNTTTTTSVVAITIKPTDCVYITCPHASMSCARRARVMQGGVAEQPRARLKACCGRSI